ncbi:hypothetical protein VP01_202g1 [Puccinia sorghi]|uniref:Uncharacterized protein n=1 Tax=Puccinia sorghi TaxID=27349 RepID=A0A0L6VB76_9BASI|nr:hypothetical protein VP01_202g1 [Puccinia sorghi]
MEFFVSHIEPWAQSQTKCCFKRSTRYLTKHPLIHFDTRHSTNESSSFLKSNTTTHFEIRLSREGTSKFTHTALNPSICAQQLINSLHSWLASEHTHPFPLLSSFLSFALTLYPFSSPSSSLYHLFLYISSSIALLVIFFKPKLSYLQQTLHIFKPSPQTLIKKYQRQTAENKGKQADKQGTKGKDHYLQNISEISCPSSLNIYLCALSSQIPSSTFGLEFLEVLHLDFCSFTEVAERFLHHHSLADSHGFLDILEWFFHVELIKIALLARGSLFRALRVARVAGVFTSSINLNFNFFFLMLFIFSFFWDIFDEFLSEFKHHLVDCGFFLEVLWGLGAHWGIFGSFWGFCGAHSGGFGRRTVFEWFCGEGWVRGSVGLLSLLIGAFGRCSGVSDWCFAGFGGFVW